MNKSYWVESTPKTNYPNLSNDINTDVLIIGGGITGILTAYMLSESDLNISIVEADRMAMGVTANTTAKIKQSRPFSNLIIILKKPFLKPEKTLTKIIIKNIKLIISNFIINHPIYF